MTELDDLPGRLRRARLKRSASLRDVATATGISNATLSEFETGKHDLPVSKAASLLRWLDEPVATPDGSYLIDQAWMAWCVGQAGWQWCEPMEPADVANVVKALVAEVREKRDERDGIARNLDRAHAEIKALRQSSFASDVPPCQGKDCGLRFGAHVDECPGALAEQAVQR